MINNDYIILSIPTTVWQSRICLSQDASTNEQKSLNPITCLIVVQTKKRHM
jgi:hypothetical protein